MSPQPDTALTAVQFEIMQVVWGAAEGATVAEIWEAIGKSRDVTRTTVLNLVGRLDKRGWLKRRKREGVFRYFAAVDRDTATSRVAEKFVDEYFGGSATELVMSLLGTQRITSAQVAELRALLKSADSQARQE